MGTKAEDMIKSPPTTEIAANRVTLGTPVSRMMQRYHTYGRGELGQYLYEQRPNRTAEVWNHAEGLKYFGNTIPANIIADNWNHAGALISLALFSQQHSDQAYPSMLICPDGRLMHALGEPTLDVFDDPGPGGTASMFMHGKPKEAWQAAKEPLRAMIRTEFRKQYLRALAEYPGHLVFGFEWTLSNLPTAGCPNTTAREQTMFYTSKEIDGFYMETAEFEAASEAIQLEWEGAGMPDNFQRDIEDEDSQVVTITFSHVTGIDGNRYARMLVQVSETGFVLSDGNITPL